ncbi:MAG: SURF1 family protein [Pseudomonadota bacterium]
MRKFRPSLKTSLATLVVVPTLMSLGMWQLERAAEKRDAAARFAANQQNAPVTVDENLVAQKSPFDWLPVRGLGIYRAPIVLLDNRLRNGAVGYEVFTPLEVDSVTVLINRGWVAAPASRAAVPALAIPAGQQSFSGKLGPAPSTGIAINEHHVNVEKLGENILRVQTIDYDALAKWISEPRIDGVLYLDANAPNGYVRDWVRPGDNPEKHEAYATQWFAMALIVAFLYIVLNLEPKIGKSSDA